MFIATYHFSAWKLNYLENTQVRLGVRKLKASHKSIQQMKAAANMKQTPTKVNSAKSRRDWARRAECVMILSIIGHSRTAVKTCPFKELWPNNLLLSHKSAYAGSKDRTTVKCDNTQDAGTYMRFQRRSMSYQKKESEGDKKKAGRTCTAKAPQHTHTMSANNCLHKKRFYF